MAVLQRWAMAHWVQLREPLGFDLATPPHATTISRTLARCQVQEFEEALSLLAQDDTSSRILHDGGRCQDELSRTDGEPVQLVTMPIHQLKIVTAQ